MSAKGALVEDGNGAFGLSIVPHRYETDFIHQGKNGSEGSSSCEAELTNSLSEFARKDGNVVLIEAAAISLSLIDPMHEMAPQRGVCLLVPPTLIQKHRSSRNRGANRCQCLSSLGATKGLSWRILSEIHRCLAQQGYIQAVISLDQPNGSRTTPADVVLFHLHNPTRQSYQNLLKKLNGEGMVCNSSFVIKALPLCSIEVTTEPTTGSRASLVASPYQIPSCPVCLHRVEPSGMGLIGYRDDSRCSHACDDDRGCRNRDFLTPWPAPSVCAACRVIETRQKALQRDRSPWDERNDVFCYCCALQETLWLCLVCGFVGCGRYSCGHAVQHFKDTNHPFSLELATLRVWSYDKEQFVHRNDLIECPLVQRHHMWADIRYPIGRAEMQYPTQHDYETKGKPLSIEKSPKVEKPLVGMPFGMVSDGNPKKATMIGEEYEALLQSALEEQSQHYEGEITRLRAALTAEQVDEGAMTDNEAKEIDALNADIEALRAEIDDLGRKLLDIQGQEAGHRAASQRLLREQAVAKDLLDKIGEEAAKEHEQGKMQVEDLEQQVADLTGNLRMRHQFSQDQELSNAQIFGTTSKQQSTKRGKKNRRIFRNK